MIESGWQAMIVPGDGRKAFREYNLVHHEIGSEGEIGVDFVQRDTPRGLGEPISDFADMR